MKYFNIHGGVSFNSHIFVTVLTVVLTEHSRISQSLSTKEYSLTRL